MLIKELNQETEFKIVYYGSPLSGKLENLKFVHSRLKDEYKSKIIWNRTEDFSEVFFSFWFNNRGHVIKFYLHTITGVFFHTHLWKIVLKDLDGLIFIADSQQDREESNLCELFGLKHYLYKVGLDLYKIPYALQLNKIDLPNAGNLEVLTELYQQKGEPVFYSIATEGKGVIDPLEYLVDSVIYNNKDKISLFDEKLSLTDLLC
jgi:mutual gliding-motility protein MglA